MRLNISFDLWGTLIKANPEFKTAKNDLIRKFSNFPNKEALNDYFINDQIQVIKKRHDSLVEQYGTQPDIRHLFAELCNLFTIPASRFFDFFDAYQSLAIELHPLAYDSSTTLVLAKLAGTHGLFISSNTLFLSHKTMVYALDKSKILPHGVDISKSTFSETIRYSKPRKEMFNTGANIHVGDNPLTDGACANYGIEFFQINTNDKNIQDFYTHVSLR